jgi:hypothetical protein
VGGGRLRFVLCILTAPMQSVTVRQRWIGLLGHRLH